MLFSEERLKALIVPLIFEQLLSVLVGFVDTLMVARSGEAAIAGVALCDNINRLILLVFSALATGGAVVCSQYIGKGSREESAKAAAQLETVLFIVSVFLTVFSLFSAEWLLKAVFGSVEEKVMESAVVYFLITALSYPFVGIYNAGAAIFRSLGNSRVSMLIGLLMNAVNIGLNAIFVFGLHMSVRGVALATLFSRIVGGILISVLVSTDYNPLPLRRLKDFIPDTALIKKILFIGIPSGLENGIFQVGKLLVVKMITLFGTASTAANSIAFSIVDFPNIPGAAMGLALITVVGQCVGANKPEQAVYYTKKIVKSAWHGLWITDTLLFIFAPQIVTVFQLSEEATHITTVILRMFAAVSVLIWPLSFTLPNALRAAGDVMYTMLVSVLSMWIIRIGLAYVVGVVFKTGVIGIWGVMFLDWGMRAFLYSRRFIRGDWLKTGRLV